MTKQNPDINISNGKGDSYRPFDREKYGNEYDRIFKKESSGAFISLVDWLKSCADKYDNLSEAEKQQLYKDVLKNGFDYLYPIDLSPFGPSGH